MMVYRRNCSFFKPLLVVALLCPPFIICRRQKNNSKARIQPSGVHRHLLLAWDCSRNGFLLPLRRPIHHREAVWNSVEGLGNMQNSDEDVFCLRKLPGCFLATRSVKSVSSSLFPSSARSTEGPSGPRWR